MNEREALLQLSKEELVAIILDLQQHVRALHDKVDRPPKTPTNSSTPPSQGRKANRRRGRVGGGAKPGHTGKSRTKVAADVVVALRVEVCAQCGAEVRQARQRVVGSSQVVEIPPVQPVVIEAQRCAVDCPVCGHTQAAAYPAGLEPARVFGPRLEALVHYLHLAHPLGYARVQRLLHDLFGLDISLGALVNAVRRAQKPFAEAADAILERIRASAVIGSDETGARVAGQHAWLWVVQTPDSAYYTIAPTRGARVLEAVMDHACPTVWVSDLAKAQLKQPALYRQICLAHQTRDLQYAIDADRCAWAYRVQALLWRAQRLGQRRHQMPPHHYGRQVRAVEHALDALLTQVPRSAWSQNLWRRFREHRQHLFPFLYLPNVPPTNNAAEQALRNAVIYRKVTGGFRAQWGATAYANVISVIETARRRGQDILRTLMDLLSQPFDLSLSFTPAR
ncbi:MAG: IS66-like element ISRhru2 family transposase [Anaerolineae bacterium]